MTTTNKTREEWAEELVFVGRWGDETNVKREVILDIIDAITAQAQCWTQVKPVVGGLYLLREAPLTTPTLNHLVRVENKIQILDENSHYTGDDVEDLDESYWWFGPIKWD